MPGHRCRTLASRRKSGGGFHVTALLLAAALTFSSNTHRAEADEGGVSYWIPGIFGSLAAVPGQPGWSAVAIYYHPQVSANRERDFLIGGNVVAGLNVKGDAVAAGPAYTFETPVLGGRLSLAAVGAIARVDTTVAATLTGPLGNEISGSRSQSLTAFTDIYWQGALKWNDGVNNYMIYSMGNFPVGDYEAHRIVNTGIGHWALDGGAGYTYFDEKKGHEMSIVGGFTYNFINPSTQYKNGIDFHVDMAASQFLGKQFYFGAVAYIFKQVTGDSGSGAILGPFESRVAGVGPQIGYLFPVAEGYQGSANLKGYKEFGAENRAEGWNIWLTFAVTPATPTEPPQTTRTPMIRK